MAAIEPKTAESAALSWGERLSLLLAAETAILAAMFWLPDPLSLALWAVAAALLASILVGRGFRRLTVPLQGLPAAVLGILAVLAVIWPVFGGLWSAQLTEAAFLERYERADSRLRQAIHSVESGSRSAGEAGISAWLKEADGLESAYGQRRPYAVSPGVGFRDLVRGAESVGAAASAALIQGRAAEASAALKSFRADWAEALRQSGLSYSSVYLAGARRTVVPFAEAAISGQPPAVLSLYPEADHFLAALEAIESGKPHWPKIRRQAADLLAAAREGRSDDVVSLGRELLAASRSFGLVR